MSIEQIIIESLFKYIHIRDIYKLAKINLSFFTTFINYLEKQYVFVTSYDVGVGRSYDSFHKILGVFYKYKDAVGNIDQVLETLEINKCWHYGMQMKILKIETKFNTDSYYYDYKNNLIRETIVTHNVSYGKTYGEEKWTYAISLEKLN